MQARSPNEFTYQNRRKKDVYTVVVVNIASITTIVLLHVSSSILCKMVLVRMEKGHLSKKEHLSDCNWGI